MKRPAWCGDCQELQPVAVDSLGFWECRTCGGPTECRDCAQTMTDDHECSEKLPTTVHRSTYRCQVQQAGSGTCTWPTCGCGDA